MKTVKKILYLNEQERSKGGDGFLHLLSDGTTLEMVNGKEIIGKYNDYTIKNNTNESKYREQAGKKEITSESSTGDDKKINSNTTRRQNDSRGGK